MFSLDRFYKIIHNNLIKPFDNVCSMHPYPFGTYDSLTFLNQNFDIQKEIIKGPWGKEPGFLHCYFFDQEPFYDFTKQIIDESRISFKRHNYKNRYNIIANSEKSDLLSEYLESENFYNWYYFFHGFAALDWYRDFQYVSPDSFNRFDKVFMCYNHLTAKYRSYRLHLVSNLIDQDLLQYGHVSLFHKESWRATIEDSTNPLDNRARVKIYKTLKNVTENLIADTTDPIGGMSANVNLDQLTGALFHVVTETVYFQNKLHLTEKVFKPIVAKRPFLLVGAPGNLAYLKSYGFRTFDRWIDESYDNETDHYLRIEKITEEIAKLCAMEPADLIMLYEEMKEVLEYNFNHFYGDFKKIIVNEMVDNFENILLGINNENYQLSKTYLNEVKQRLSK